LSNLLRAWQSLPVVARALIVGLAAAAAGTLPWALLVSANTKYASTVPWAVPPTALYLWLYWRYARGDGWPRSTADARRRNSRMSSPGSDVWPAALLAGGLGLVAVMLLQGVLGRMVALPQQQDIDPSKYPVLTVIAWVIMSAAVAGITEEISFRGYMQSPIERRHGPVVAILVTGLSFGFVHFAHPEVTLAVMPFYVAVAAVYGGLAWLTDSVYPGMVLHAGGNVFVAFNLFTTGRSEWEAPTGPQPLIWESGPDAGFWIVVAGFLVSASAAVAAYVGLAGVAGRARRDAMG
jgi:membrane protease YdiL (CAAX protease family)